MSGFRNNNCDHRHECDCFDHNHRDRYDRDPCGGEQANQYRLALTEEQIFFGSVTVGTISDEVEVFIKNIGWAEIVIRSMQVTGSFTLDRTKCPDVLKPGREGKLVLHFVPTQYGAQTGSVFIDAGRAGEHYIAMAGAGFTTNENGADLAGIPIFDRLEVDSDSSTTSLKDPTNLVYDAGSYAYVVRDPTLSNNDIYRKVGASGTGSWVRAGLLANTIDQSQRDMEDIAKVANEDFDFNGDGLVETRENGDVPTLRKLQKDYEDSQAAHETDWEASQTAHEGNFQEQIDNSTAVVTNAYNAPDPNNGSGIPGTVTVAPGVVLKTLALTLVEVRDNNRFMVGTWAALAAITGRQLGATAEVPTTDAGTHVSVVGDVGATGGNSPNSGIFSLTAGGWRRIGDFTAPQLAAIPDRTSNNKAASPLGVESQITAHLGDPNSSAQMNYRGAVSVQNALDQLFYSGISITSMTVAPNQIETGNSVNVTVSWTVAGNVTGQTLEGVAVTPGTLSKVFNAVNASNVYDLIVQDADAPGGTASDSESAPVTVLPKWYAGAAPTTTPNDATLRGFAANGFATVKGRTVVFNAAGGTYPCYAWPASLGALASVKVGGLSFTDYTVTTRDVVNAYGATISMNIFVFNTVQTGTSIEVIFA